MFVIGRKCILDVEIFYNNYYYYFFRSLFKVFKFYLGGICYIFLFKEIDILSDGYFEVKRGLVMCIEKWFVEELRFE